MNVISNPVVVRLLRLPGLPLLRQLWLEEALYRSDTANWFIINDGVPDPTIVLGISGKPHELVNVKEAHAAGIPLVRRFTGGGTVVVDSDSILTSIIMHGPTGVPHVQPYPRPIMQWTENVFSKVLNSNGEFSLRENDYVLGQRKFGGNAQAISGSRWLHHTSFLWDYQPERMSLLKHPSKAPEYRAGRDHSEFVMTLKQVPGLQRESVVEGLAYCLENEGYQVVDGRIEEAEEALARSKHIGTKLIPPAQYL